MNNLKEECSHIKATERYRMLDDTKREDSELREMREHYRTQKQIGEQYIKFTRIIYYPFLFGSLYFIYSILGNIGGYYDPEIAYQNDDGAYIVKAPYGWQNTQLPLKKGEVVIVFPHFIVCFLGAFPVYFWDAESVQL